MSTSRAGEVRETAINDRLSRFGRLAFTDSEGINSPTRMFLSRRRMRMYPAVPIDQKGQLAHPFPRQRLRLSESRGCAPTADCFPPRVLAPNTIFPSVESAQSSPFGEPFDVPSGTRTVTYTGASRASREMRSPQPQSHEQPPAAIPRRQRLDALPAPTPHRRR